MKFSGLIIALSIVLSASSCNSKQNNQSTEQPTQSETDDFNRAAKKIIKKTPETTSFLKFEIEAKTYEIDLESIQTTIVPFAVYKPADEEEQQSEESLLWLKGHAKNDPDVELSMELVFNEKLSTGKYTSMEGSFQVGKEFKYLTVENIEININSIKEVKFDTGQIGYSIEMTFEGTVKSFGPNADTYKITNGEYKIKF